MTYGVREDLSSSPYRAARLWIKNYSREFVQIQSGDILLSGALYFPKLEEDKKIPAIVLAHGSGPTTQYNMGYYIYLGLKMDSAVLVCDKRGVGNSEGVFDPNYLKSEQHFTELASDLVAQLKWIKSQPEIDLTKIGMMGPSQAGWIMPIAAKMDNSVRFIVSLSGPTVSVGVENYFSSLTREYMSPPGISIEEADKELSNFSGDPLYDPVPILEELQTNILWQFGTHDRSVPVSECIRVLEKLNKTNFDIKVVQHVGHGSTNIHTGEYEDFVQIIKPWLIKIGVVEPWD
ncbi:MAG: prolyl oligopeptidase family serine peptidase [Bacteroidota bacterium]